MTSQKQSLKTRAQPGRGAKRAEEPPPPLAKLVEKKDKKF